MITSVFDTERLISLTVILNDGKLHVAELLYLQWTKPWHYDRDPHLVTVLTTILGVVIVHEERKGIALDISSDDYAKGIPNHFKIKLRSVSKTFPVLFIFYCGVLCI